MEEMELRINRTSSCRFELSGRLRAVVTAVALLAAGVKHKLPPAVAVKMCGSQVVMSQSTATLAS